MSEIDGIGGLSCGVSVVVPVYRSRESLPELAARLTAALRPQDLPFEVIFVDDGSPDDTWETLIHISVDTPEVRALRMSRNYGQHQALFGRCPFGPFRPDRHHGRRPPAPS